VTSASRVVARFARAGQAALEVLDAKSTSGRRHGGARRLGGERARARCRA
jgi:hypothetical protein